MNSGMLKMAAYSLKDYYRNADEIVQNVIGHAALAAGSAALSGAIPGAGSTIAATISIGIIAKMYFSLGNMLGVRFGNGVLKALASAVVADLAGSVAAILAVATALSFVPGLGSLGAAGIVGLTSFCYVYLAGIIYIKMVSGLLKSGKSIDRMTADEVREAAKREASSMNMKAAAKEATSAYKASKR